MQILAETDNGNVLGARTTTVSGKLKFIIPALILVLGIIIYLGKRKAVKE
jgi:hypothetical protein